MIEKTHPYSGLPDRSFWPKAAGTRHFADVEDLWEPFELTKTDRIATAGSCFAQHLGKNLKRRGANFMNMEPAPAAFSDTAEANRWGFDVFSCRYGNIYTVRQLLQLFREAFDQRQPRDVVWERDGRYFDALRAGVDPIGWESAETVLDLRKRHLARVREMFCTLDLFVFTLGLTKTWEGALDESVFPTAPGVVAGEYKEDQYRFRNFNYPEVLEDLTLFWNVLREVNASTRMLLTISPVPLMATASKNHVLVATNGSKSILRAAAGEFSDNTDGVYYFPSYEIINSPQARGMAFDPDQRSVNQFGVDLVMKHFFTGKIGHEFSETREEDDALLICDEEFLAE